VGEALGCLAPALQARLAQRIAINARSVALATLAGGVAVDVAVFDREGRLLGRAGS
jgi:hypothetical protein